jgi:hypothetical protein
MGVHQNDDKPGTTLVKDADRTGYGKTYARHGRIDLEPMPSDSPADPLNWSS